MRNRRPSHATVVSYVALFVALGGTGYAALKITGKDVVNRSLTGKELKRNSLRGREVKESKLGTVPQATEAESATHAGTADSATHAGTAESATHAGTADSATIAGDAATLAGLGPAAFLRSSRVRSGTGILTATSPDVILSFPELGIDLRTDGTADMDHQLIIVKSASFPENIVMADEDGTGGSGDSVGIAPAASVAVLTIYRASDFSRRADVQCDFEFPGTQVGCTAVTVGF